MLELLSLAIAIIGSLAAGLYDLKTSNIPDKLCITMIILGLIAHFITGFSTGDFSSLINAFMFGGLFLAFGLLMYFTGQWGGGDGELLVAIGVLLPSSSLAHTHFPFALSFFINSFFIGAFYSILYSFVLAYRNPKIAKSFFKGLKGFILIPVLFLFCLSILLLAVSQYLASFVSFLFFILIVFYNFSKSIEQGFYKRIPVSKLKVDDMIGEDIPRLKIYKNVIRGLTKEEVRKIKGIKRYVTIKEGIRYGLVFSLTLLFTLFFGDIFFLLL
jgi:Flp pilus assembly protein protease CpaA